MEKSYLLDEETLLGKIQQTVSVYEIYIIEKNQKIPQGRNKIFLQSKGIILEYRILTTGYSSKLLLSAMSPFCAISAECEEMWINRFLHDLDIICESKMKRPFPGQKTIRVLNYLVFGYPRL